MNWTVQDNDARWDKDNWERGVEVSLFYPITIKAQEKFAAFEIIFGKKKKHFRNKRLSSL